MVIKVFIIFYNHYTTGPLDTPQQGAPQSNEDARSKRGTRLYSYPNFLHKKPLKTSLS